MKIKLTQPNSTHPNHDTLSLFDNDGREIAYRRSQTDELIRLLRQHRHRTKEEASQYFKEAKASANL